MFKIIQKVLGERNQSRLFTIIGLPGIGKSSLIKNTMHYISERNLIKGGIIYINARNITVSEQFLKKFNDTLIADNPVLFGIAKEKS